jgi:hypothetical protein
MEQLGDKEVVLVPLDRYNELLKRAEEQTKSRFAEVYAFRDMLADVTEVEAVLANWDRGGYDIWTVTDEPSEETRERIYRREWELMERYLDTAFDFNILARAGEELESVVTLDSFDLVLTT